MPMHRVPLMALMFSSLFVSISATSVHAADGLSSEPYKVFVTYDSAYARCGPSNDYYRTDSLRQGQELEVYVETADGWLGVRPPENSFCWIPASAVKTANRGATGEVTEDRTVAWIGTHLGRAKRYRWQVQLAAGESVSIIGRSEREGPDGPQMWYRIVPPSGEFRWVHRNQIALNAEELIASIQNQPKVERPRDRIAELQAEVEMDEQNSEADSSGSRLADLGKSILNLAKRDAARPVVAKRSLAPKAEEPEPTPAEFYSATSTPADSANGSSRRSARNLQRVEPNATLELKPVPNANSSIAIADAPASSSAAVAAPTSPVPTDHVVGSGVSNNWRTNPVRTAVADSLGSNGPTTTDSNRTNAPNPAPQIRQPRIAQASFVSRPRLTDIGVSTNDAAPQRHDVANDSNWIVGATRSQVVGGVQQVSAQLPHATTQPVSADAVARVASESRGASIDQLQLLLSRVMASRGSAAEAQPIADAASVLMSNTTDQLVSARAKLLMERVQQYQRVAQRRDLTVIQPASYRPDRYTSNPPVAFASSSQPLPVASPIASQATQASPAFQTSGYTQPAPALPAAAPSVTGYLVQVYSARSNSPPYALTDHAGNTLSYVTPSPGINLRNHLNSYITVSGSTGFLPSMGTPHVLATQAMRAIE